MQYLILAKSERRGRFARKWVLYVVAKAILTKIKLFSLVNIIIEYRATKIVRRVQHILDFVEMVRVINKLVLRSIQSSFDFDRHCVAKISARVDFSLASITGIVDHDSRLPFGCVPAFEEEKSIRRGKTRLGRYQSSPHSDLILQRKASSPQANTFFPWKAIPALRCRNTPIVGFVTIIRNSRNEVITRLVQLGKIR